MTKERAHVIPDMYATSDQHHKFENGMLHTTKMDGFNITCTAHMSSSITRGLMKVKFRLRISFKPSITMNKALIRPDCGRQSTK